MEKLPVKIKFEAPAERKDIDKLETSNVIVCIS